MPESGAGDDQESIRGQTGDSEIAFDAAPLVQTLGIDDRPNLLIDIVGADMVQEGQGAWSAHFKFVEGSLIEQAGVFTGLKMFVADGTRPIVVGPADRFVPVAGFIFIGGKPVGALPAGLLSKRATQIPQAGVRG